MLTRILTLQAQGFEIQKLHIESIRQRGLPPLVVTGLPDSWLRDARDKIRALVTSIVPWKSTDRVLAHLFPAEVARHGSHLELPLALACLCALNPDLPDSIRNQMSHYPFVGALSLDGSLQSTAITRLLEGSHAQCMGPGRFQSLSEIWNWICSDQFHNPPPQRAVDFQEKLPHRPLIDVHERMGERAWILAALAAEIPILLVGPPGTGKSHLARWASSINPPAENSVIRFEIERIYEIAEQKQKFSIPCVTPHPRSYLSEFIGAKREGVSRPGFFALAHGGTLILDEFSELPRDVREILRTVLDQGRMDRLSSAGNASWPTRFQLIATSNPCACGFARGHDLSRCICTSSQRQSYGSRLSGPLFDRFGLRLFIDSQPIGSPEPSGKIISESGEEIRTRIQECKKMIPSHLKESEQQLLQSWASKKGTAQNEPNVRRIKLCARLLSALKILYPESQRTHLVAIESLEELSKTWVYQYDNR